jgi:hypothetical protein
MHISVNITEKEELSAIISILKDVITSVEIIVGESPAIDHRISSGYSEAIPGITTLSKRGFCKSIPTLGSKGIQYRSRVEAKWAYMFENLNWECSYEPEDSPGYIPDFCLVWGNTEIIVEVKSNSSFGALDERFQGDYEKAEECLRDRPFLLVGGAVWKHDEGSLIGVGIYPKTKQKFKAFIVGNGDGIWSLKIQDIEDKSIEVYPPLEDTRPTHKTVNSMWISASNKTTWKPVS